MRSSFVLVVAAAACGRATTHEPTPASPAATTAAAPKAPVESEVIPEPNRALTADERALLKPIFRDGIDYDHVRVINASFPFQPDNVYMTPRGHVYAPGRLYREDFAHESAYLRAIFVHEMTHVWQHSNGMDLIAEGFVQFRKYEGQYEKAYAYLLENSRDLVDYGMEQQASIVQDYYLINENQSPESLENHGLNPHDRNALYTAVLGQFLVDARYARALDPKEVADRHALAAAKQVPGPDPCSVPERGADQMCAWRFKPTRTKP
jgi:hypothetical protein